MSVHLRHETGDPAVDQRIASLVTALEGAFPGRGLSYHLLGSHAEGRPTPTSDVDLIVLFPGTPGSDEASLANLVIGKVAARPGPRLDVETQGESTLSPIWEAALSQAAVALYGELEAEVSMPSIERYSWALIEEVCSLVRRLRPRRASVSFPVDYPDREATFFGYEQKPLLTTDGTWMPSSKAMAMVTGWGASAILAVNAGVFTPTKSDLIPSYRKHIADDWTQLLAQIEDECRLAHNYLIPSDEAGRSRLRAIAARVLEFENHVLASIRPVIHARLAATDESDPKSAAAVLHNVGFPDIAVGSQ